MGCKDVDSSASRRIREGNNDARGALLLDRLSDPSNVHRPIVSFVNCDAVESGKGCVSLYV